MKLLWRHEEVSLSPALTSPLGKLGCVCSQIFLIYPNTSPATLGPPENSSHAKILSPVFPEPGSSTQGTQERTFYQSKSARFYTVPNTLAIFTLRTGPTEPSGFAPLITEGESNRQVGVLGRGPLLMRLRGSEMHSSQSR